MKRGRRAAATPSRSPMTALAGVVGDSEPVASTSAIAINPEHGLEHPSVSRFKPNNDREPVLYAVSRTMLTDLDSTSEEHETGHRQSSPARVDYDTVKSTPAPPGSMEVSLPWHKHFYGITLPLNPDGEAREAYLHTTRITACAPFEAISGFPADLRPGTKAENAALREQVHRVCKTRVKQRAGIRIEKRAAMWSSGGIDWEEVCKNDELSRRSPFECRIRWSQHEDPGLEKSKWTKEELERLYAIAESHHLENWAAIAFDLNRGQQKHRTAVDCIRHYRARPTKKVAWSPSQDQLLKHAIRIYGENWQSVARMVGRHSNQCINRWTKTVRPHRKGKWSAEEDEDLLAAVKACGPNWSKVADRVQGRSDAQCRERFSNVLDPNLNWQDWSPEEDEIIKAAHAEYGGQWGKIVSTLNSKMPKNGVRTDNKVMRRWEELSKAANGQTLSRGRRRSEQAHRFPVSEKGRSKRLRHEDADTEEDDAPEDEDEAAGETVGVSLQIDQRFNGKPSLSREQLRSTRKRRRLAKTNYLGGDVTAAVDPVPSSVEVDAVPYPSANAPALPKRTRSGRSAKPARTN